jgi:protein SCO1/2
MTIVFNHRRSSALAVPIASAVCAALLMLAAAIPLRAGSEPQRVITAAPAPAPAGDLLPAIDLVDQNGRTVSLASFKGKPVLVSFIHASCLGVCELMTAKMRAVAQSLGAESEAKVTMLSITTDPAEDGPKELRAYAKKEGVNADGWVFLTGKPDRIARLLVLYGVPYRENHDEETHVMKLFLLGPDGREVHRYSGIKVAAETVAADINARQRHISAP